MASANLCTETSLESVVKQIYTSCDSENTNEVLVSVLIEFVKPFVVGDQLAFEALKAELDPSDENRCISSETFYEIMTEWIKKIEASDNANHCDEFNKSANQLDITEEKNLPFTQSTPRASFGQKFLSCESLLHFSNVTGQELSIIASGNDDSILNNEKQALQEEIKRLELQYNKVIGDMAVLKSQLTFMEEQNETLLSDLRMCKTRLINEQQTNEQLQKDKIQNDELREEISLLKSQAKELSKKLHQYEKDNGYISSRVHILEQENTKLMETSDKLKKHKQSLKTELSNIKTDLEMKDQELQIVSALNDELKSTLIHEKEVIQQLTNDNDLLDYKKNTLEKRLHYRRYSAPCNISKNGSQGTTSLIPIYSSPKSRDSSNLSFSYNSPSFLNKIQSPLTPILDTPVKSSKINLLRSVINCNVPLQLNKSPEFTNSSTNYFSDVQDDSYDEYLFEYQLAGLKNSPQVSLQTELIQSQQLEGSQINVSQNNNIEEMNSLKLENDLLESKLKNLEEDNKKISLNLSESHKVNETLYKQLGELKNIMETKNADTEVDKLKKDYQDLQIVLQNKEKELLEYKNKFNFEFAYKSSQAELNQTVKEIEKFKHSIIEFKDTIRKLSNRNQDLEQQLGKAKVELHQIRYSINKNNANGDNKLENNATNTHYKKIIEQLEKDIESKNNNIIEMNENLHNEIEIKNNMWKINKDLKLENDKLNKNLSEFNDITENINQLRAKNKDLLENLKNVDILNKEMKDLRLKCEELNNKLVESDRVNKKINEDYNNILLKYNTELNKNDDLNKQVLEMPGVFNEYHEELNKNIKLIKQIDQLNSETLAIKENQEKLRKTIAEYEDLTNKYASKIHNLEKINESLTLDLQSKKNIQKECNTKLLEYQEKLKKYNKTIEKLKTEVNEKQEKTFLENNPSSWIFEKSAIETKNLSFDKQKLTIDRLKEKIENLESRLVNVKSQNDSLKEMLKNKESLEEKWLKLQKEFSELQSRTTCEKQSLQNVIDELSYKMKEQEEYYKELANVSIEKINELSVKVAQLEEINRNVQSELNEKALILKRQHEAKELNNVFIKNVNENLCKEQIKNQSLANELKNKEALLNSLTINNEHMRITKENLETQVRELLLTVDKHEQQLHLSKEKIKVLTDQLQEKDCTIDVLKNDLSDVTHKSLENNDAYEALVVSNKNLQGRLSKTDDSREEEIKEYENFKIKISLQTDILVHCCKDLYRVITLIKEKWQIELQKDATFNELMLTEEKLPVDLEDQIFCVAERVSNIVLLLEILINQIPTQMEDLEKIETLDQEIKKPLKKFTLRPSRFIIGRPVSPDSPSLEISVQNEKTIGDHLLFKNCSMSDSPDSQFSGSEIKNEIITNLESHTHSHLHLPVQLPFDDAFPHLTDSFLEKIGLHEDSAKQILSKEETENIFTSFAIQMSLDMKDIKGRLENQKAHCQRKQKKCLYLIKDICMRLREHKCIGAVDSINPVFVLLEDIRFILQEIIQSAGQLGILSCENRMMRCWNLVTNYMAILQKEAVLGSPRRRTSLVDKGINASISKEHLLTQELSTENIVSDETNDSIVDYRNKDGYSYHDCFQYTKKFIIWFLILMVLLFVTLISIHWQCQMVPEHVICPLDEFIKKVNIGTPPY